MILSDKDLQLLSSMPQNDSENDRKDNDLKIGKNFNKIISISFSYGHKLVR